LLVLACADFYDNVLKFSTRCRISSIEQPLSACGCHLKEHERTHQPSDIARETLRLLASRRVSPTPDNYRQHYQEITGHPSPAPPPDAERHAAATRWRYARAPGRRRLSAALDKAAVEKNWDQYRSVLLELIEAGAGQSPAAPVWAQLVLDLLKQWRRATAASPTARKRESLERLLGVPGSDPDNLAVKLRNLVASWSVTALAQVEDPGLPAMQRRRQRRSPALQETSAREALTRQRAK